MEVLHGVAVHEGVDVLRVRVFLQGACEAVDEGAEGGSFGVGEFTERGGVAFRFDDEPAAIRGLLSHRVYVACVDEFVLVENAAFCGITLPMLLANEAASRLSVRATFRHRARLPDEERVGERRSAAILRRRPSEQYGYTDDSPSCPPCEAMRMDDPPTGVERNVAEMVAMAFAQLTALTDSLGAS